jgi:hypothetical protein
MLKLIKEKHSFYILFYAFKASKGVILDIFRENTKDEIKDMLIDKINMTMIAIGLKLNVEFPPKIIQISAFIKIDATSNSIVDIINAINP